jgi:hypothetical protein
MREFFRLGGGAFPIGHRHFTEALGLVAQQDVGREAEDAPLHLAFESGVNGHDDHEHEHAEHHADQRDQGEGGKHRPARVEIAPGEEEAEGASFDGCCYRVRAEWASSGTP